MQGLSAVVTSPHVRAFGCQDRTTGQPRLPVAGHGSPRGTALGHRATLLTVSQGFMARNGLSKNVSLIRDGQALATKALLRRR